MTHSPVAILRLFFEALPQDHLIFLRDRCRLISNAATEALSASDSRLFVPFENDLQLRRDLLLLESCRSIVIVSSRPKTEEFDIRDLIQAGAVIELSPRTLLALLIPEFPLPTECDELTGEQFWLLLPTMQKVFSSVAPRSSTRTILGLILSAHCGLDLAKQLDPGVFLQFCLRFDREARTAMPWSAKVRQWFIKEAALDPADPKDLIDCGRYFFSHLYELKLDSANSVESSKRALRLQDRSWFREAHAQLVTAPPQLLGKLEPLQATLESQAGFETIVAPNVQEWIQSSQLAATHIRAKPRLRPLLNLLLRELIKDPGRVLAQPCDNDLLESLQQLLADLASSDAPWHETQTMAALLEARCQALEALQLPLPEPVVTAPRELGRYHSLALWRLHQANNLFQQLGIDRCARPWSIQHEAEADQQSRDQLLAQLLAMIYSGQPLPADAVKPYQSLSEVLARMAFSPSLAGKKVVFLIDGLSWHAWQFLQPLVNQTLRNSHHHRRTWPALAALPTETQFARGMLLEGISPAADSSAVGSMLENETSPSAAAASSLVMLNCGYRQPDSALLQRRFFDDDASCGILLTGFIDKLLHDFPSLEPGLLGAALQSFFPAYLQPLFARANEAAVIIIVTDHGFTHTRSEPPPSLNRRWRTRWGIAAAEELGSVPQSWLRIPAERLPWLSQADVKPSDTVVFPTTRLHFSVESRRQGQWRFTHGGITPDEVIVPWSVYLRKDLEVQDDALDAIVGY